MGAAGQILLDLGEPVNFIQRDVRDDGQIEFGLRDIFDRPANGNGGLPRVDGQGGQRNILAAHFEIRRNRRRYFAAILIFDFAAVQREIAANNHAEQLRGQRRVDARHVHRQLLGAVREMRGAVDDPDVREFQPLHDFFRVEFRRRFRLFFFRLKHGQVRLPLLIEFDPDRWRIHENVVNQDMSGNQAAEQHAGLQRFCGKQRAFRERVMAGDSDVGNDKFRVRKAEMRLPNRHFAAQLLRQNLLRLRGQKPVNIIGETPIIEGDADTEQHEARRHAPEQRFFDDAPERFQFLSRLRGRRIFLHEWINGIFRQEMSSFG